MRTTKRPRPTQASKAKVEKTEPTSETPSAQEIVEELLRRFAKTLKSEKDVKLSVTDCIRLLQLHKELADETPREIEVRWVENANSENTAEG